MRPLLLSAFRTAIDCSERCTTCGLAFFVRDLGIVQTRWLRSNSSQATCDLLATLSGQRQQFNNATIATVDLSGG